MITLNNRIKKNKTMKTITLLKKLETKPIFRVQDVERIYMCDRSYAKLLLHRLTKRGIVKRVARNAYTLQDDIWLISSNIVYPCYISFWSASYFLGYTEQIVNTIYVATTIGRKPIEFEGYTIEFVPLSEFFGYKKIRTEKGDIFIAENEKLLIDAFLRPEKCGNFAEIVNIYENAEIDEKKVIEYLKRTKKQSVIKRVGYLLEKTKKIDISYAFNLDRNYVLLNPFSKEWSKINSKWRVKI